jgi:HEAT repeat protein
MNIRLAISTLLVFSLLWPCVCMGAAKPSQDDAIDIVLQTLRSDDQQMQAAAIAMVKEMPGKDVTKALAKELPHLSATSQVQLLSALGDRGDATALLAVVTAAKAKDPSVRTAALRALGQLGDASSVELLAQAAAGSSGDEQKAARSSLYRLRDPKVDQVILADVPKADAKTKFELVRSVGERDIRAATSVLLKTAGDEDDQVRIESLRVLKIIAGPADLPALVGLLINAHSSFDRGEAEKTIVAVAHKIEDKSHRGGSVLAVLPTVKDVQAKCSLLSVLGKIGDNDALPALRTALKDKNDEVQSAAIRAMASWPTPEPVTDLMNVAQSSNDTVHKILALRGVVRLLDLDSTRPAEETVAMYAKAMSLSPDVAEKKRVLSGLAHGQSLAALQMAATYLDDETLSNEAGFAAIKIAQSIEADFPEQAMNVLKKIAQTAKSDSLRRQAAEVIKSVEHPQQKVNVQGQEVK